MDYKGTLTELERLHSLIAEGGDDSNFSTNEKRWIQSTYKKETGNAIRECKCKNKYTDAVVELLLNLRKKGALAEDVHYVLRRGVIIWVGNDCYSRHNITDAIAKDFLEKHPDGIELFEKAE